MTYDKNGEDATPEVGTYHKDQQLGVSMLMSAMRTADADSFKQNLGQLANLAAVDGEIDEGKLNQLVSGVKSIEPRDEMESMLACQMAAIHDATMNMASSLKRAGYLSTRSEAERSLNRLARTLSTRGGEAAYIPPPKGDRNARNTGSPITGRTDSTVPLGRRA